MASEIWQRHLAEKAAEPVNVDAAARRATALRLYHEPAPQDLFQQVRKQDNVYIPLAGRYDFGVAGPAIWAYRGLSLPKFEVWPFCEASENERHLMKNAG